MKKHIRKTLVYTKYLNKLLTTLNKSDYNILNKEDLIRRLRKATISAEYKIISFDVKIYLPMYLWTKL